MDVQQRLWELSQGSSDTTEGVVLAVDWAAELVTVDANGLIVDMRWDGPAPWEGDRVRVLKAGQKWKCTLIQGSPMGTIITTGSGFASVTGDDDRTYWYPYLGDAPANGARVRLDHAGHVVLAGAYSAEPDGTEIIRPTPPPEPSRKSAWFTPQWSGNWSGGSYSDAGAEISSSRAAAYGYGKQIAFTVPDTATVKVARLVLVQEWDNVPGVASSMGTHGFNQRPGSFSNSNLSGSYSVPGGSRTVSLPGPVWQDLITGAAFGIGFRSGSSGWRRYQAAPGSGRIYMEWET